MDWYLDFLAKYSNWILAIYLAIMLGGLIWYLVSQHALERKTREDGRVSDDARWMMRIKWYRR